VPEFVKPHIKIHCDDCSEKLERERMAEEKEIEARLERERFEDLKENYSRHAMNSGIPPLYHAADINSLVVDKFNHDAVISANKFITSPGKFLTLAGNAGRGKTWLAVAVARELIVDGKEVKFVRSLDMLDSIREGFKDNSSQEEMDFFKRHPNLIIDDLAVEKSTDWAIEQIYSIIDHRYCYQRSTIITTNLKASEIAARMGSRIASRLRAAGDYIWIDGKDRRLETGGRKALKGGEDGNTNRD
jgi:DNA replication protein DnaC